MAASKKGSVATAAIVALLVAVAGIGIADYYLGSSHAVTDTTTSVTTASFTATPVIEGTTKTSFIVLNYTTTQMSSTTLTTVSTSTETITPKTTLTVVQTQGNVSQIAAAEAVLYSGVTATSAQAATSSLLVGVYNPNATTYITSMILESSSLQPILAWDNNTQVTSASNQVSFSSAHFGDTISGNGLTTVLTLYPSSATSASIVSGQTYQYAIFFASGVSVEGSLVAQ